MYVRIILCLAGSFIRVVGSESLGCQEKRPSDAGTKMNEQAHSTTTTSQPSIYAKRYNNNDDVFLTITPSRSAPRIAC